MLVVRQPALGDVLHVADRMRAADVAEGMALGIIDLRSALHEARERSRWCLTAVEGRPVAMFGVRPWHDDPAVGAPWFLATDDVVRHRRAFMMLAPYYIAQMLREFPRLKNRVHARNTAAVAWLSSSGFTLEPAHTVPGTGEPFHWFTKEA